MPPLHFLHFLLLLLSVSRIVTASMDPLERDTLFQVMDLMSSDRDWRASSPDPCVPGSSWPGIECKRGSDGLLHVTRLDFGAAPNPICNENATFPSQIFQLPHIQSIFFIDCFKGTLTSLSLPAAHASLQLLCLRSNPALVGGIPPNISLLASLQVLTLSQNQLHGAIPDAIFELDSLTHLDLSYSSLTGSIPPKIGRLNSLIELDLSYNSFTGLIPLSIGQLGLLQKLDLTSNSINGSIPDALQSLISISFLALSSNRISGEFPKGIAKLQNLEYFIMDDNPMFVTLPLELGRLGKLQELRLANSGYYGMIPASFAWLSNLTTLSLEGNKLAGRIPAGLSRLGKLYHLNLSQNLLTGAVPFDATFLEKLGSNLDLRGNSGLCLNGTDQKLESVDLDLDVCGFSGSGGSSKPKTMEKSGGASFFICYFCHQLMGSGFLSPLLLPFFVHYLSGHNSLALFLH